MMTEFYPFKLNGRYHCNFTTYGWPKHGLRISKFLNVSNCPHSDIIEGSCLADVLLLG